MRGVVKLSESLWQFDFNLSFCFSRLKHTVNNHSTSKH